MRISLTKLQITKFTFLLFCLCTFSLGAAPIFRRQELILQRPDPLPAQKVITKFLQWYKVNLKKANSFPILVKDSNDYFMVNKKAVTDYLNFLKSSKCISPKYIAGWQTFFDDKAIQLAKEKLQSDMPEGFDFDFVLITQEPDLVLNQINRIKFKTVSMNNSVALIGLTWPEKDSMKYEFEMYKSIDGWQIGYISTPNFD